MPVQFEGIGVEHKAVREQAGLFDISHMGQFLLAGESAAEFLDYLFPRRISRLFIGQMLYAPMCNEEGGCIDDAVVYRLAEREFLLVVNASRINDDWNWIARWATRKTRLQIDNLSDKICDPRSGGKIFWNAYKRLINKKKNTNIPMVG